MQSATFFKRFAERHEIGRDISETHLSVFYDDGQAVGRWRLSRSTTIGQGEVLSQEDTEKARHWCRQQAQGGHGRAR